ncbi:MAG: hypothetical protein O3A29_15220, partial [Planctomycetota bacterium]|nr:hypothetical protein [Planctomycetota bacterium]
GAARWFRCPFSAACTGRTGRRLIGEFWPGAGCSGVQFGPNLVTSEGFLARLQGNSRFLGRGGARKPLQRRASQLYSGARRLGRLSGVCRALNGYICLLRRPFGVS